MATMLAAPLEPAMSKDDTEKLLTDILCYGATAGVAKVRARWIAEGYWELGGKTLTDRGRVALLRGGPEPRRRYKAVSN
jgi:hypothetical protein